VRDALADERALVADHVDLQVVAFGIDEVDLPLDGIGDGDRVGAALLMDGDAHDWHAVELGEPAHDLVAVNDIGHVPHPDRASYRYVMTVLAISSTEVYSPSERT